MKVQNIIAVNVNTQVIAHVFSRNTRTVHEGYHIPVTNVIGHNTMPMNSGSTKGHNTRISYIHVKAVTLPQYIQHALKRTNNAHRHKFDCDQCSYKHNTKNSLKEHERLFMKISDIPAISVIAKLQK